MHACSNDYLVQSLSTIIFGMTKTHDLIKVQIARYI